MKKIDKLNTAMIFFMVCMITFQIILEHNQLKERALLKTKIKECQASAEKKKALYNTYLEEDKQMREEWTKQKLNLSCAMYGVNKSVVLSNGLYFTDGFYCVATKGRNTTEIASTKEHEKCHALVHTDYYHFCEEYYDES